MSKTLFLPGAGGSAAFWRPVAVQLHMESCGIFLSWPGLGSEPHAPEVTGIDDLVAMVVSHMAGEPLNLVAQSMGGLVAIKAALSIPTGIRRLVLTATSGGVPIDDLGAFDWRISYRREYPNAAKWITSVGEDLSEKLRSLHVPTLLVWGDADRISPPSVGERLQALLPNADLRIIRGGDHDLAQTHAVEVAAQIAEHLL